MRRLLGLVAVLVLVTTACKIETNFGAVIEADGSGTIIIELGVDEEAAQFFLDGTDPFQGQDLAEAPGARTREEQRGDLTFYIIEVDVEDVSDLQNGLMGADGGVLNDLTITVDDDQVSINGSASAEETIGSETEGLGDLDFDIEEIFSANVYFTMPGAIIDHNADRQDGNTLYWEVPITGGTLDIRAESDPTGTPASGGSGSGGFPTWGYAVLALLVLGAGWYFMQQRPGGSAPKAETVADVAAATPAEAPAQEQPSADTDDGESPLPPPVE
jgi:hypothetical protein